jgi:hypothetical protein
VTKPIWDILDNIDYSVDNQGRVAQPGDGVTEVVTPMGVGAQRDAFLVASAVVLADTHTPAYISTASLAFDPRVTPYPEGTVRP